MPQVFFEAENGLLFVRMSCSENAGIGDPGVEQARLG